MGRRLLAEREAMMSRELSAREALTHFPAAVKNLKSMLVDKTSQYADVRFSDLIQQVDWFVDGDGDLMAKSWYFSLFNDGDASDYAQDSVMIWDGSRWLETSGPLGEAYVDNPELNKISNGGVEPVPGDETGKDEKDEDGKMTMEADGPSRRWVPASKHSVGHYEEIEEKDEDDNKVPPSQRMSHVQRFEKDIEAWIEHQVSMPEYESLRTFQNTKLDDDSFEFDFIELNALARSLWRDMVDESNVVPPHSFIKNLKQHLIEFGFEFKPRKSMKMPRSGKNSHGTHPFAGMGGGGSGFGSGDGSAGGRGPGNVGGKYDWDSSDAEKNLPMGAGAERRKK